MQREIFVQLPVNENDRSLSFNITDFNKNNRTLRMCVSCKATRLTVCFKHLYTRHTLRIVDANAVNGFC